MTGLSQLGTNSRRRFRRGVSVTALVGFVFASMGVSWTVGPRKDRSVAFPCMDRACGCHTAASCKQHCCCYSDDEKLAWAAEHHVSAAPFVRSERVEQSAKHCDRPASAASVAARVAAKCCSELPLDRRAASGVADDNAGRSGDDSRLISMAAYRACRGLWQLTSVVVAALPPPKVCDVEFEPIVTEAAELAKITIAPSYFSPPTPPPRS